MRHKLQRDTGRCGQIPNTIYSIKFILDCCCLYYQMFVVFNRKMYVVDFYFQLFRSPRAGEVVCDVARSVLDFFVFMNLQSRIPSPCTRWIFMLHIHLPSQHAHQRTRVISDGLGRRFLKHEENIERASGESRSSLFLFYIENMAANRELVLVRRCFYQ